MTDNPHFHPFLHTLEGALRLAEELFHVLGAKGRWQLHGRRIATNFSIKEMIQLARVEVFGDVFTDEKRVEILRWSRRFRQIGHFSTLVRHEYLWAPVTHDGQAMT